MDKKTQAFIGGAIGLLVGAALTTTKKGKEINEQLEDAFNQFDSKVSKFLSTDDSGESKCINKTI